MKVYKSDEVYSKQFYTAFAGDFFRICKRTRAGAGEKNQKIQTRKHRLENFSRRSVNLA